MTNDGYNPHFDIDLERGKVGERAVEGFLKGNTHEVKKDDRVSETGNFYVETWQYSDPFESDIRPSGINVTQAEYWHWSSPTGKGGIWMETETLKELMTETNPRETRQPITNSNTNASKGRLVPLQHVLQKLGFVKKERNESPEN